MMRAWYRALYPYSTGVRFSHASQGVVGKLRDSRGNGLAGETPQESEPLPNHP
jgi:hypothetical protein